MVIPVVDEELELGKRDVPTGSVTVTKTVRERPAAIREQISSEHIEIERIPRDEIVATPPPVRTEGNVTIIPVIEEVLLVTRQLRLKEELKITKTQVVREYREDVTLRSEELTFERLDLSKPD